MKEPRYMQATELFSNQVCPVCASYMGVVSVSVTSAIDILPNTIVVKLRCLNKECSYEGKRDLI